MPNDPDPLSGQFRELHLEATLEGLKLGVRVRDGDLKPCHRRIVRAFPWKQPVALHEDGNGNLDIAPVGRPPREKKKRS